MTDQETPEGGALPSDANASPAPETKVETTGSEAGSSPAAADPGEKKADPPKDGRDIRISELTRRLREAERRNERLLKLAEDRGHSPSNPSPARQPVANNGAAPDPNASAIDPRKLAADLREEELSAIRRERFEELQSKFAETTADYYEAIDPGPDPEAPRWACSKAMAEVIEESDEGPAVAYYLARNPEEARKLAKLSPAQAGRAIARLEDRLVSERKKALQKPVSQAPPPPPKIEGADPGNVEADPSKMTDAQFRKWREKQIAARNK